jgi:hypothetical protein
MRLVGGVELGTLVLLLGNVATVHLPELSRIFGPVHGLAYTAAVLAAAVVSGGERRVWLWALVPGVGGLLAARRLARETGRGIGRTAG